METTDMRSAKMEQKESRSVQRRIAAQKGEPAPDFSQESLVEFEAEWLYLFDGHDERMPEGSNWKALNEEMKEGYRRSARLHFSALQERIREDLARLIFSARQPTTPWGITGTIDDRRWRREEQFCLAFADDFLKKHFARVDSVQSEKKNPSVAPT